MAKIIFSEEEYDWYHISQKIFGDSPVMQNLHYVDDKGEKIIEWSSDLNARDALDMYGWFFSELELSTIEDINRYVNIPKYLDNNFEYWHLEKEAVEEYREVYDFLEMKRSEEINDFFDVFLLKSERNDLFYKFDGKKICFNHNYKEKKSFDILGIEYKKILFPKAISYDKEEAMWGLCWDDN